MNTIFLFLCLLLFPKPILTADLDLPENKKKLFEQACISPEDCDTSLGLSCQIRVCRCDAGGATIYSSTRGRCVGSAGRECVIIESNNETLCVPNSVCHDYGYMHLCTCKEGFYQSRDGNCYLIAKYGQPCLEEEFSCGDTLSTSISCVGKKCGCVVGDENQYFDPKEGKCTSYPEGQCIPHYYKPCSEHSICTEQNENVNGVSFMVGYRCRCGPGYSLSSNKRRCLGQHGTPCNSASPCNWDASFLGCLNGKCQCRNPLNEVFNEGTQECLLLVGSNCKLNGTQGCVEQSSCAPDKNNSRIGKCACNLGYSSSPLSTCLLDINQPCAPGISECNYFNGLTCINETCNCIDSLLSYDKVSKSCVSLVGLPCGAVSLLNEKKEVHIGCEANSVCSKVSYMSYYSSSKRICKPVPSSPTTNNKH